MSGRPDIALAAARALRGSEGYRRLDPRERAELDGHIAALEHALAPDPYAPRALATPADLLGPMGGGSVGSAPREAAAPVPPPPAPVPSKLSSIAGQTADVLEAVNFSGFVAGLVQGTFQAIVDATLEQVREYAKLVRDLSRTVDEFTRENVSSDQVREQLARRHPRDLVVVLPAAGKAGSPRLAPQGGAEGSSPEWLTELGLEGAELTDELCEGELLEVSRRRAGEDRMQHLATMLLMGLQRIVVNDGDVRARLQFHATARERTIADVGTQQLSEGIAGRSGGGAAMMVSTLRANAQADASLRADLMGEVRISFRTETFALERFADSQALQLIQRHAKTAAPPAASAPAPAATAPARTPPGEGVGP